MMARYLFSSMKQMTLYYGKALFKNGYPANIKKQGSILALYCRYRHRTIMFQHDILLYKEI